MKVIIDRAFTSEGYQEYMAWLLEQASRKGFHVGSRLNRFIYRSGIVGAMEAEKAGRLGNDLTLYHILFFREEDEELAVWAKLKWG